MLMSNRLDHRALVALVGAFGLAMVATGCKEEFSDDKFGVLDLASFYDGGTQTDPSAGVPEDISVERGYIQKQITEFYDFGVVPVIKNTSGEPIAVRVQPMYFFFNSQGYPMFSRPIPELKTGTDWMKGGKGVLDPNPKDFCQVPGADPVQCESLNSAERAKSYPLRRRDYVVDNIRGVSDYQRPLVDVVPGNNDPPSFQYTGLWEMIEVTVPDDYEPDAIKQVSTLKKALDSGKFSARSNGRVINCPIVDERTAVARGITSRGIYHPRVELWYRRQLGFCFLANGWETLGNPNGELYFAKQDDARFDTMDVSHIKVGSITELAVPVGRIYIPYTFYTDPQTFQPLPNKEGKFPDNLLVSERPKRGRTDPAGYSPMRWVFKIPVAENVQPDELKSVDDLAIEDAVGAPVQVRNISVRGVAVPCSYPPVAAVGGQCGKVVSTSGVVTIDPTGDPACNAEKRPGDSPLECNPDTCFCDAPFVGYNQACGPGIAQCLPGKPDGSPRDKFSPFGYRCFPPWGGFCQRACNPALPNTLNDQNEGKKLNAAVDSRCGGLPGMLCLGGSLRTCVKFCDQNVKDENQCSAVLPVGNEMKDTQAGQTCQDFGVAVCAWPDSYSPQPFPIPQ
jgi:hypothetical protein